MFTEEHPIVINTNGKNGTETGQVNGASGTQHALVLHAMDSVASVRDMRRQAQPGALVWIQLPPVVSVKLDQPLLHGQPTLVDGENVIPLKYSNAVMERQTVKVVLPRSKKEITVSFGSHCYDLGGASTIHKLQGSSKERLIIDIRAGQRIKFGEAFTAITRVKSGAGLRLLPGTGSLAHLKHLKLADDMQQWYSCFRPDGTWRSPV